MSEKSIPKWFTIVAIIAVIWNIMGVMAYLGHAYMSPEEFAAIPDVQKPFYENIPVWVTACFAMGVFAGLSGSILLLIKRKAAQVVFVISLIGVLGQFYHNFFKKEN